MKKSCLLSVFDLGFEAELYEDNIAINLLFIQAIEELSNGWIEVANSKIMKQLQELKEKNLKIEVLIFFQIIPFIKRKLF